MESNQRSDSELQSILDSLIGEAGYILCGDLPDGMCTYEREHDVTILDPGEDVVLRDLVKPHGDLRLGPEEMFGFLNATKLSPARSPDPGMTTSQSLPPTAFRELEETTPRQHRRRNSDRIRSPSDSSSSSDENTSAPTVSSRPGMPKRPKTLSDSHMDSPLAARTRHWGPPSAFGNFGSFARPSPASRRRRGSANGSISSDVDGEEFRPIGRSMSSRSFTASPTFGKEVGSPLSEEFHSPKSPESVASEQVEVQDPESEPTVEITEDEVDETDDQLGEEMLEAMNPRLSRLSTGSSLSLRTSHDKLQALQKQNGELARKLKESERQLALLGADNDRMVMDLERQLEEARHELALKRKEDKDLRNNELAQKIQISGLEADLSNVQRLLEQSKESRASMQKMYDSQCEIRTLEETAQEHEADEAKYTGEIQSLEMEVKRMQSDLESARRAESVLEVQKQENLQLKETIDRMRFDLDEARAAAANALRVGGHAKIGTSSSGAPTLSRNLGDEINRRLADGLVTAEQEDEDEVVETVVTRRQRAKVVEYADVSVGTDEVPGPSRKEDPPAYTAEPEPVNVQEVLDQAHPKATSVVIHGAYDAVVSAAGRRCTVLEEDIKRRGVKAEGGKKVIYASHEAIGWLSVCTIAAFAIGIVAGTQLFTPAGMHSRDYLLFSQMNDLARSVGVGEGFLPVNMLHAVGHGAGLLAGRVPS
ncbi:hypothetical protein BD324DRAFT_643657 [Kockovaella imperatae]|uniref:Uncharacterized protein n=1 Tax=Kockovaella imperatae TaxID=4999 RepID=A0A1Y1U7G2_9TREE|nr:hypothetical protein BD324DRAFT_643657 [Kockovaella imperatae]ORX33969.1 hypothetical protein BD324DRAFT_643657 [Kockovaella imperatae]